MAREKCAWEGCPKVLEYPDERGYCYEHNGQFHWLMNCFVQAAFFAAADYVLRTFEIDPDFREVK